MEALTGREGLIARERRWALPVALMTLAGIGFLVASMIVAGPLNGDGNAEELRAAHEHSFALVSSGIFQAIGFALLAAPLLYLFRAAQARSPRVRGQLVGLIVAAPLFFSIASVLNVVGTDIAASDFVAGKARADITIVEAKADCRDERRDDPDGFRDEYSGPAEPEGGVLRCAEEAVTEDAAADAIAEPIARAAAVGFGLGGRIGLAFALLYTCLWAMRVGLLSRFWGSLGMALGAVALLLLIQFVFIWFIYFALLVAGWVPGGRPPAWAAGEAIPWPTPGEKAASELEAPKPPDSEETDGELRKRKQRD